MDTDNVNSPSHYNTGKIEVIEAIEDWNLNFSKGNAVKYIARAGHKNKDKEIEDLKKAEWYVRREIERLEKESQMAFKFDLPDTPRVDVMTPEEEKEWERNANRN